MLLLQWRHNERDGFQSTGVSIVCKNICSGADQRKHQSSASLAVVRGVHRWPVSSPNKGPKSGKCFDDVIMVYLTCLSCIYMNDRSCYHCPFRPSVGVMITTKSNMCSFLFQWLSISSVQFKLSGNVSNNYHSNFMTLTKNLCGMQQDVYLFKVICNIPSSQTAKKRTEIVSEHSQTNAKKNASACLCIVSVFRTAKMLVKVCWFFSNYRHFDLKPVKIALWGHFVENAWGEWPGMLIYPDYLQKCLDFGHGQSIFIFLSYVLHVSVSIWLNFGGQGMSLLLDPYICMF